MDVGQRQEAPREDSRVRQYDDGFVPSQPYWLPGTTTDDDDDNGGRAGQVGRGDGGFVAVVGQTDNKEKEEKEEEEEEEKKEEEEKSYRWLEEVIREIHQPELWRQEEEMGAEEDSRWKGDAQVLHATDSYISKSYVDNLKYISYIKIISYISKSYMDN